MKHLLFTLAVALVACCDAGPPVDPVGTWEMVSVFGVGTCGSSGTEERKVFVTELAGEFVVAGQFGDETVTGPGVSRTSDSAVLEVRLSTPISLPSRNEHLHLFVSLDVSADRNGVITGAGTTAYDGSLTCFQDHTITGAIR